MGLEQVGVEAVVEGLSSFRGGVGQINSILDTLRPQATTLQNVFSALGEGLVGFANRVWDVFSVTLGVLIRDAINAVVDAIKELIAQTIEAGGQFQIMELRLQRLNFNDLRDSTLDYNQAQAEAIRLTQEQLDWLLKLAAQTPYDAEDVANTFTLARAYGFTAGEAQGLTEDILDFASGMGLTAQQMERVIVNFGQLESQGKLNMMELRDLARGAFVPINDVLERMKINMGLTNEEFDKMRLAGELTGPAVKEFFKAFHEMVGENFAGAAEQMASAFQFAVANAKDLIQGIGGLKIVKPILEEIGTFISEFVNNFTKVPERWDRLVAAATRVGEAISSVVRDLFGLIPSTEGLADGLVGGVENLATWIETNHDNIVGFFKNIGDTIRDDVIPFIKDKLLPAVVAFVGWIVEHKGEIVDFFINLGTTIAESVVPFVRDQLIPAFQKFGEWFAENKDQIILFLGTFIDSILQIAEMALPLLQGAMQWITDNPELVAILIGIWGAFQVMGTVINVLIGIVIGLVTNLAALVAAGKVVLWILGAIATAVGAPIWMIGLLAAGIAFLAYAFITHGDEIKTTVEQIGFIVAYYWNKMWEDVGRITSQLWFIVTYYWNKLWDDVGRILEQLWFIITYYWGLMVDKVGEWVQLGADLIQGFAQGISDGVSNLIDSVLSAVQAAYDAASNWLWSHSPSKRFFKLGEFTMKGMAEGILSSADLAANAMSAAVQQMSMPAIQMQALAPAMVASRPMTTSNSNTTNNLSLTVNSAAPQESVVQDFNMLQSLASG